ncbi:MAG: hypothetical protein WA622_20555 [Mycobacterium sp.]|uniref:hypothetical protein n=1 Tax=Mycobacterium sp. TaxID=1785 RepID=UPI003BB71225
MLTTLIIAVLIGLIPAAIAKGKGEPFGLWWLYGAAVFIVALCLCGKTNTGVDRVYVW